MSLFTVDLCREFPQIKKFKTEQVKKSVVYKLGVDDHDS